jgi:hypothetical protein
VLRSPHTLQEAGPSPRAKSFGESRPMGSESKKEKSRRRQKLSVKSFFSESFFFLSAKKFFKKSLFHLQTFSTINMHLYKGYVQI